ncbi:uncharacterized protein ColSpa_09525 [Colletotrichum spaethianum]|uniref:Uncharacterized protein n=1 Tax=Colletotrichum spaethianum TaxID=700344 RepID=A0AA37PBV4_9PEZI|nr:uncharacterized protein ColSpa_09525 [Colletotrichum spaethianum]GKT49344.1 hypothetical protein ColSpa_09525 [Colletotrichum spaethianum]
MSFFFASCSHACSYRKSGLGGLDLAEDLLGGALDDTTGDGQAGALLEEQVDLAGGLSTFVDTPDESGLNLPNNEGLATAAVTGSKDTRDVGAVLAGRGLDVLAGVLLDVVAEDAGLGAEETHGEEDEVGREELLRAVDLLHVPTAGGGAGPLDADGVDALDLAGAVVDELLGHDAVLAGVLAHVLLDLGVAVVHTVDAGPLGPRVVAGTLRRGLGQELKVDDRLGSVADGGTDTVVTSVTTADDDDVLALGRDVGAVLKLGVEEGLGVLVQELHGVVDALELTTLDGEVTGDSRTGGDDDSVVLGLQVHELDVLADGNAALEVDALSSHEVGTALDDALVELHVGDTVHEQTTGAVSALVDGDGMSSAVELVGGGQTSRAGTDDGDLLTGADLGRGGDHPSLLETAVDDGALDGLDTDGVLVDAENAGTLAGSRADTTGELGEVVGHEQTVKGVTPLVLEDQLVPLGNDVGDGATGLGLAERNTAVHATSGLVLELVLVETGGQLGPILGTGLGVPVLLGTALVLHETLGLVQDEGALLLGSVVANGLLNVLELGGLLFLLGVNARDNGKVVLGTLGLSSLGGLLREDTLVVDRHDLDEARQSPVEVHQDASGELGTSVVVVVLDEAAEIGDLGGLLDSLGLHHLGVELREEVLVNVEDVGDTAGHTGSEVAASAAQNDDTAASHVLATVVADTLNDSGGTGVTDGESLRSNTTEEASTLGSTVQADVTNDDVLLSLEHGGTGRVDNQATTGQTLADVVVGITLKLEGNTGGEESTEGLTSGTLDVDVDSVQRQTIFTVALGDVVGQRSTHGTVGVDNVALDSGRQTLVQSQLGLRDKLVVQADVELVVLLADVESSNAGAELVSRSQEEREVDVGGLVGAEIIADPEDFDVANHLVDGAETKLGHDGTELVGDVVEEVDNVLGSTGELLAKLGVLGGDTNRARVQVTLAHEDAAHGDERSGSEAPFLSTEQASHGDVTTSAELAVSLDNNTATEVVQDQSLVGLGKTELPGETGVLDTGPAGGAGTTIVTRDQDVIGLGLGNTGRDDTDTDLGHELDGDARAGAGALQVVNQLLQILNRVNIVVRRGRDETDAGGGVTGASNGLGDLVAGKLTTLTGLGSLGHLDLKLVGVGEVGRGDTEATGGNLLDGGSHGVAVGQTLRALGVLTTFTGVGLAAKSVHGNGQGGVRLHRDGTVRHGTSAETADDLGPGLDLLDGDGSAVLELEVEHTTERASLDLLVLGAGVRLVGLVVLGADGILDVGNAGGVVHVSLTTIAPVVLARLGQASDTDGVAGGETTLVEAEAVLCDGLEGGTLDTGGGALEAALDDSLIKTKSLENLGTLVRSKSRDTHLAHDLEDTTVARVLVVVDQSLVGKLLLDELLAVQLENALHREVGVDGIGTVAEEDTHVVDLTSLGSLDDNGSQGTPLVADQVVVNHTRSEQGRNGDAVLGGLAVGQDNDAVLVLDGGGGLVADVVKVAQVALGALALGEGQVNDLDSPLRVDRGHVLDGVELGDREDGAGQQQTATLRAVHLEQVALRTDVALQRHNDRLTNGVDGRVGDLGEELTEVLVQKTGRLRQASQGGIVTHGPKSLLLVGGHGSQEQAHLLVGVAKGQQKGVLLKTRGIELGGNVNSLADSLEDLGQGDELLVEPCAEVLAAGDGLLQLLVVNDAAGKGVDEQHATGLETALLDDLLGLDGDGADLGSADDAVVVHDVETARAQTVTVEVGTAVASVGESEESGTVPRLHLASSPLVESSLLGVHVGVALPGLGDHEHDSLGQRQNTVDGEQLQDVVESSRVRTTILNNGVQTLELLLKDVRLHDTLSGSHPVLVSTESVDFTVVGGPSQRLSTIPGGEGVGRETGVDKGEVGLVVSVDQIVVVLVDLDGGQLSLVDNVLVGEGAEVKPVLETDGVGGALSEDIQLSFEESVIKLFRVDVLGGVALAIGRGQHDKGLHNDGFTGLGSRAKQSRVNRRPSPSQDT